MGQRGESIAVRDAPRHRLCHKTQAAAAASSSSAVEGAIQIRRRDQHSAGRRAVFFGRHGEKTIKYWKVKAPRRPSPSLLLLLCNFYVDRHPLEGLLLLSSPLAGR